jgi:tetratricopeptide (TPR) repeat protein
MNELREKGNDAFKRNEYRQAIDFYSQAIEMALDANRAVNDEQIEKLVKADECIQKCYNNRAQCHLKLKNYAEAVDDASKGKLLRKFSMYANSPERKNLDLVFICSYQY